MIRPTRAASVALSTLDPSRWSRVLEGLKSLGFDTIDLPLVWRDHDRASGRFDFRSPRLDIAAFARAVSSCGLRLVVRLGPTPVEGLHGAGIPERILRDPALIARTRRNNPRVEPCGLRLVPMPSLASRGYRHEARLWVTAALDALARAEVSLDAVVLGEGRAFVWRDEPGDGDHHPDARMPADATPAAWLAASTEQAAGFLEALVDATVTAGVSREKVVLSTSGPLRGSALVARLAESHGWAVRALPPRAGVEMLWREFRAAHALPQGCLVTLHAGASPTEGPIASPHARAVADLAFAAGIDAFSVHLGAAGEGYIGALLDAQGTARPAAARWAERITEAARFPTRGDVAVDVSDTLEATNEGVGRGVPLGFLAALGIEARDLAPQATRPAPSETAVPEVERLTTDNTRVTVVAREEAPVLSVAPPCRLMTRYVDDGARKQWVVVHDHPTEVTVTRADGASFAVATGTPTVLDAHEGGAA